MRRLPLFVLALLLLGAPAARADGGPVPPAQGGFGATAPGVDVSYVAVGAGAGRTIVEAVRRPDAMVEVTKRLRGDWGVPGVAYDGSTTGLSGDGRTLVIAGTITRYPVRRTRLLVLDTVHLTIKRRVELPGYFVVDGISPDGRRLYFLHYRRHSLAGYEVRWYDLRRGRLARRPIVDPREPDEKMQGMPVTRTVSPDGRWAYTLYMRPDGGPFVHALDTERATAACVDLDGLQGADLSGTRLSLHGSSLRVGTKAVVDTRTFAVGEPRAADPAGDLAPPAGADGPPWGIIGALAAAALAAGLTLSRVRRPRGRLRGPARTE